MKDGAVKVHTDMMLNDNRLSDTDKIEILKDFKNQTNSTIESSTILSSSQLNEYNDILKYLEEKIEELQK